MVNFSKMWQKFFGQMCPICTVVAREICAFLLSVYRGLVTFRLGCLVLLV